MVINPGQGMNPHVFRNYFHDTKPLCGNGDDNSAMHVGGGAEHSRRRVGALVEYNLYVNIRGDDEIISNKSSGNTYQFNTAINGKEFVNRHGEENQWIANWLLETTGLRLHDRGHKVFGNVAPQIRAYGGTIALSEWGVRGQSGYPQGRDLHFAGNEARVILGYSTSDPFQVQNTMVEANEGEVVQRHVTQGTITVSSSTSQTIPKAFKLTPSQVGPHAPTAPTLERVVAGSG
jgi:hypothetical protein